MSVMRETFQQTVTRALPDLAILWRCDRKGVSSGWCRSSDATQLLSLGEQVAKVGGRLSMITAYLAPQEGAAPGREVAYHFELDGDTFTLTILLPRSGATLPSLTPLFANADWNEREMMELYDLKVEGHPDPRPLFIDDSAGPQVFERLVPFSTFVSGASSQALWERVLATQPTKETL
ncbi:MAG: hypothetical protein C0621_04760 [Desulfuromonas sp.]|nr:MAG: hypothetical protein C0621_04760 [Desulfuromonas sp.]